MIKLSSLIKSNKPLSKRQLKQIQKWLDDDWESHDYDRDLTQLVQRLLVTINKMNADKSQLVPGTKVRMSASLKDKLIGICKHSPLFEGECLSCSFSHLKEFGDSIGIVDGLIDYNNCNPSDAEYDQAKIGPEVNVRWLPSNLRYGYHPDDLEAL